MSKKRRMYRPVTYRTPRDALLAVSHMMWYDEERAKRLLMAIIERVVKEPDSG